jgi:hypothetical protein
MIGTSSTTQLSSRTEFLVLINLFYCNPIPTIITGPEEVIDSPWPAMAAS